MSELIAHAKGINNNAVLVVECWRGFPSLRVFLLPFDLQFMWVSIGVAFDFDSLRGDSEDVNFQN